MDFHGLIIIACVFLVSLVSLLVINRVFRGKTFEEVAAEKKLLAERLYGGSKSKSQRQVRKVATKKVKDKKQKSKDAKETDGDSQNDSDNVETLSADSSPTHKRDSHVEFLEPTIINDDIKKGVAAKTNKAKATKAKAGILINKSEEAPVKDDLVAEPLNHFESNPPKDVLETKKLKDAEKNKQANKDAKKNKQTKKDDTDSESQQTPDLAKLKQNDPKKDVKPTDVAQKKDVKVPVEPPKKDAKPQQAQEVVAKKEVKQEEVAVKKETKPPVEKHSKVNDTQKSQTNKSNKKKKADNHFDDIDKLDNADVSSLISVLGRAELTRNEIQILIDFLLNKQQDTPHNHSEWSDDIVQKLRKQLAEKEKALQEEQEASAGIQAKLRELRTEINTERTQNNANIKAYTEEIQAKKAELRNLSQELESVNEKLTAERQKYQAKVLELQNNSQDVVAQLNESNNILKTELLEKNDLIREFQLIANAARQSEEEAKHKLNEVAQHNNNRVVELEISLQEATKKIERQMSELEVAKMLEKEKDGNKVEIRNLQNALDSTKAELSLALNDVHTKTQHNEALLKQIDELNQQLRAFEAHRKVELGQIEELNQQLRAFEGHRTAELDVALTSYKKNISELNEQLSHYKVKVNSLVSKEDELMKQIKEEKEKNNLQPDTSKSSVQEQNRIRELFQRLFPESAAALQNLAFSISFDQWIEQLAKHIKQHQQQQQQQQQQPQQQNNVVEQISHNNKTKTTANSEYSNNHVDASSNNHHDKNNDNTLNHKGSENDSVPKEVLQQNIQLKAQIAELTSIVTKTENTLRNLEAQARDQEAHWRSVVQSKDEEINILRNLQEQAT